eukprot:6204728-Pleurochrysis_carterae.AAC.3
MCVRVSESLGALRNILMRIREGKEDGKKRDDKADGRGAECLARRSEQARAHKARASLARSEQDDGTVLEAAEDGGAICARRERGDGLGRVVDARHGHRLHALHAALQRARRVGAAGDEEGLERRNVPQLHDTVLLCARDQVARGEVPCHGANGGAEGVHFKEKRRVDKRPGAQRQVLRAAKDDAPAVREREREHAVRMACAPHREALRSFPKMLRTLHRAAERRL